MWQPRLEATLATFIKVPRLEIQAQSQLKLPGITCGSDFAKERRRQRGCWVVERRSVEEIEDIGAKLHPGVFARQERKVLHDAYVGIEERRTDDTIASTVAESP